MDDNMLQLRECVKNGSFFSMPDIEVLRLIFKAYEKEINYLKTAYAASCPDETACTTLSPSQILYQTKYAEVDRTLTGVLSLRWIRNADYDSFTNNQNHRVKLSRVSFDTLCDFFRQCTDNYKDTVTITTLLTMQVTNDLGKSSELKQDLRTRLDSTVKISQNHDMIMQQTLCWAKELMPSFQCLDNEQDRIVRKLIHLSANFNPGQLVQAECPAAALEILDELVVSSKELDIKFLEYFLDLAGAKGHVNHEGASTLIEPVFQVFWSARRLSMKIARQEMNPRQVYNTVLTDRLRLLQNEGWGPAKNFDIENDCTAFAKTRIFCMGRAADIVTADLYNNVYDGLPEQVRSNLEIGLRVYGSIDMPAVLPTYTPAMLVLAAASPKKEAALASVLTYVGRSLQLSASELADAQAEDAVILERDVKDELERLILSDEFKEDPASVVNDLTPLSGIEVAKTSRR